MNKTPMALFKTKPFKVLFFGLLLSLLSSCLEIDEHIILKDNGSGRVVIKAQSLLDKSLVSGMGGGMIGDNAQLVYPPMEENDFRKLFPGETFKIEFREFSGRKLPYGLSAEVSFSDINELLKSPYAKAKSLEIIRKDGKLHLRCRTGLSLAALLASLDKESSLFQAFGAFGGGLPIEDADIKQHFSITMPGAATSKTGRVSGNLVEWRLDRTGMEKSGFVKILDASCLDIKVAFAPQSPPRLTLDMFEDLEQRAYTKTSKAPSALEIKKASRFYPRKLVIRRGVTLSGGRLDETYGSELHALFELDKKLAPEEWGKINVHKIRDSFGKSLKLSGENKTRFMEDHRYGGRPPTDDLNETKARKNIRINFASPKWGEKKIALISGEIEMFFFSEQRVVKIPMALGKEAVHLDQENSSYYGQETRLRSPGLDSAAMEFSMKSSQVDKGMLNIVLSARSRKACLLDVAVFDRTGNILPVISGKLFYGSRLDDEQMWQLIIPGIADPPLSLALLIGEKGDAVKVPFELKDVILRNDHDESRDHEE